MHSPGWAYPNRFRRPLAAWLGGWLLATAGLAQAQQPGDAPSSTTGGAIAPTAPAEAASPLIPPEVQLVRFHVPDGVKVEILGPTPEAVPTGDAQGQTTFGLKVGVGYRLKITNLPGREKAEIYPVLELVGHLHRPPGIDPTKYPIRVVLREQDFADVADHGRLVTQIIYLETPESALPLKLPKDEIPSVTLSPAEDPMKVARALGRVVAVFHLGGRAPLVQDLEGSPIVDLPGVACPFVGPEGGRCALPCGPACGTPPPPGRPWLPRDEFLCDGGDHGEATHFAGDGSLRGVDPRDAVIQFQLDQRPRVLPTNMVCLYAPRFAVVRGVVGSNEALTVQAALEADRVQKHVMYQGLRWSRKLTQAQTAELNRHRSRASNLVARQATTAHAEIRVLGVMDQMQHVAGHIRVEMPGAERNRQRADARNSKVLLQGIKLAEGTVISGRVEAPGQTVMSWKPQEMAGVEVPPNKPGLAVIKQVSANEAEPGDTVTFTIRYKNIGNVPIRSASIIDSLLPRLEYVPRSATGPKGTVFTAGENRAGSMELRWDLPEAVAPGAEGSVTFEAIVR